MVEQITSDGCKAWGLEIPPPGSRFSGAVHNIQKDSKKAPVIVRVQTDKHCKDYCLLGDLPIMAGYYDIPGKAGAYYEILIHKMPTEPGKGLISIGQSSSSS